MKRFILRVTVLLALAVSFRAIASGQQQISVSDIALGSNFDAAISKLRVKGLTILPVTMEVSGDAASLEPQTAAFAKGPMELFAVHAIGGRIIYVNHYIKFAPGSEPDLNTTLNDLKQKFGHSPTFDSDPNRNSTDIAHFKTLVWQENAQHQVVSRDDAFSVCQTSGGGPALSIPAVGYGVAGAQNLARLSAELHKNPCTAGVVAALITPRENPNVIMSLNLGIVDQAAIESYDAKLYAKARARTDEEHQKAVQRKAPM